MLIVETLAGEKSFNIILKKMQSSHQYSFFRCLRLVHVRETVSLLLLFFVTLEEIRDNKY